VASPALLRPSDAELRRLYVDQRLSAETISKRCDVEKITVLRWLRAAGIKRRPGGNGLANRGIPAPTADDLQRLVHVEHLSYEAIGERYGVDFSAVPHWLDRHGIERPDIWVTRRHGRVATEPTEEELRERIGAGESLRSIERDFDVTRMVIRARCRKYGIEVSRDGWSGGYRLRCADGHQVRSTYEQRVDDWLSRHDLPHTLEPRYPFDRRYRADFLVDRTYIEVWGVTGNPAYTARRAWKIEQCASNGIDLIQINHWQFATGRRWWRPLERLLQDLPAD